MALRGRQPLSRSDLVCVFVDVRDAISRPIRHCISSDDLVLETDHRRVGPVTLPSGLRKTAREFFHVIVRVEDDALAIRSRRMVTCSGYRFPGTGEMGPRSIVFAPSAPDAVEQAGVRMEEIVGNPDSFLPRGGHSFPRTGGPGAVSQESGGVVPGSYILKDKVMRKKFYDQVLSKRIPDLNAQCGEGCICKFHAKFDLKPNGFFPVQDEGDFQVHGLVQYSAYGICL